MSTTYVTVAIPYVNADPHLGYAYELVAGRHLRPAPGASPATTCASSAAPTTTP